MDKLSLVDLLWEEHIQRAIREQTSPRERLLTGLEQAKSIYEDSHRQGVFMALKVVTEYLEAEQVPPLSLTPLRQLESALFDLERGIPHPLFRHRKTGRGRHPDPFDRSFLKIKAAVAVELLRISGSPLDEAAEEVGQRLEEAGIRIKPRGENQSKKSAGRTIKGWRKKVEEGTDYDSRIYGRTLGWWESYFETPQEAAESMISIAIKSHRGASE